MNQNRNQNSKTNLNNFFSKFKNHTISMVGEDGALMDTGTNGQGFFKLLNIRVLRLPYTY
jgi:hypothetical protein